LQRTRRRGLVRNAALALGNALVRDAGGAPNGADSATEAEAALTRVLGDVEPVVRGAAAWALGHGGRMSARGALDGALTAERDPAVQAEIAGALRALDARGR
jgi:epoxyqueuosine reductase